MSKKMLFVLVMMLLSATAFYFFQRHMESQTAERQQKQIEESVKRALEQELPVKPE